VPEGGAGEARPSCLEVTFETWFEATWPRIVRVALANVRTWEEAEDIASDTCTKLLKRWEHDRPEDPTGWAIAVASNRARKFGPLLHRTFGGSGAAQISDDRMDLDLIDAIRDLPPRQRRAIALRYLGDLTQGQVAELMGVAPGTAAALLNQGRSKLRTRLGGP
jgi:RNA polymerase sigma-70 factor (ECF subfamily)